jgi:PleD family two-component response regulator
MCIVNSLYILVFGVIVSHNPGAAPGVISPLITIVVCTLIHYYSMQSIKAQEELEKQNEDLIETNNVITKEGERLSRIVYNDNLTGLFNKEMFAVKLDELIKSEEKTPFTVVYTEINDFDKIVKSRDNASGDMILTTFASVYITSVATQVLLQEYAAQDLHLSLQVREAGNPFQATLAILTQRFANQSLLATDSRKSP